jgi:hypothetical protein
VSLIRDIFFNFDELFRIEIPFNVLYEVVILCSAAIEDSNKNPRKRLIIKQKNVKESKRTLFIFSYMKQKQLLGKLIGKFRDFDICFTKIEWNQRTYFILVVHQDNRVLDRDQVREMKAYFRGLV